MKHEHYFKDVSHLSQIDVYRVLQLFGVTDPAIGHAVKKLLCSGQRGAKDAERDWREAVDSIERALQMQKEDGRRAATGWTPWSGVGISPSGEIFVRLQAGSEYGPWPADRYRWGHTGAPDDIVAYRPAK